MISTTAFIWLSMAVTDGHENIVPNANPKLVEMYLRVREETKQGMESRKCVSDKSVISAKTRI